MMWVAEEFSTVALGDKRLNSRLVNLVEQRPAKPTAGVAAACGSWGDTAAAYHLLDHDDEHLQPALNIDTGYPPVQGLKSGRLHEENPLKTTDFWRYSANLC